jgi:hypothetical protein
MIYEPGPFAIRTPMPLGPRVTQPGSFLSDVATIADTVAGFERGFTTSITTIAPIAERTLDPDYNRDVTPAFTGLDLFDTAAERAAFAAIAGAADGALSDVDRQMRDLPGAGEQPPDASQPPTADPGANPPTD